MPRFISTFAALCMATIAWSAEFKSDKQKQSYGIGYSIGENLKNQGVDRSDVEAEAFMRGIEDSLDGKKQELSVEELKPIFEDLNRKIADRRNQRQSAEADKNGAEGALYLEENKKREGVKVTKSGLQYEVLRAAKGEKPTVDDRVKVHYRGTFVDGSEFDSSYKREEPTVFGLKQVVPGWTEALQLMSVGEKFRVVIPGNLAYGMNAPASIGPNRLLIFEIELIAIEK